MKLDETFESIAHPLRIKILKLLVKEPMSFSDLKKKLRIKSSGKLDFHLKKLGNLITLNSDGKYTLTRDGYSALQAITVIEKYGWQKRAYIIATATYLIVVGYILFDTVLVGIKTLNLIILVLTTSWYLYYSYWCIVKRKVFKTQ